MDCLKTLSLAWICLLFSINLGAQNVSEIKVDEQELIPISKVAQSVKDARKSGVAFQSIRVLELSKGQQSNFRSKMGDKVKVLNIIPSLLGNLIKEAPKQVSFSIPVNEAKRVATEIIETGKSTRPVLGIYFDTAYEGVGAKIARLSPGEAADKAGIPIGSVIRSIDGIRISDLVSCIVRIRSYAPGDTVSVLDPDGWSSVQFIV